MSKTIVRTIPVAAIGLSLTACKASDPIVGTWKITEVSSDGYSYDYFSYSYEYGGCSYDRSMRMMVGIDFSGFLFQYYQTKCEGDDYTYAYAYGGYFLRVDKVKPRHYEIQLGSYQLLDCSLKKSKLLCDMSYDGYDYGTTFTLEKVKKSDKKD